MKRTSWLLRGYCCASCAASAFISSCAAARVAPSFSRTNAASVCAPRAGASRGASGMNGATTSALAIGKWNDGCEHSDDGVGLPVERETAAEHARIAAETRAPERCAQDDDALGSGVIVRRFDQAAQKRSGAEQRQHVAGDQDAIQPLRLCAGAVIKELRRDDQPRR